MFRWHRVTPRPLPAHQPNLRWPSPAQTAPSRRMRVRRKGETMVFTMYLREGLPLDPRWEEVVD